VPKEAWPALLSEIRRVLASKTRACVVEGDPFVLPVHYRRDLYDAILLVNLTHEERRIHLRAPADRPELLDGDGRPVCADMTLAADEVKLLIAR